MHMFAFHLVEETVVIIFKRIGKLYKLAIAEHVNYNQVKLKHICLRVVLCRLNVARIVVTHVTVILSIAA